MFQGAFTVWYKRHWLLTLFQSMAHLKPFILSSRLLFTTRSSSNSHSCDTYLYHKTFLGNVVRRRKPHSAPNCCLFGQITHFHVSVREGNSLGISSPQYQKKRCPYVFFPVYLVGLVHLCNVK